LALTEKYWNLISLHNKHFLKILEGSDKKIIFVTDGYKGLGKKEGGTRRRLRVGK
jgi:hypothetical protein